MFYVEREQSPRRTDNTTRFTMATLSRLFDWKKALIVVKPDTLVRWCGLHSRSPGHAPELQSAVRADEVVMTPQDFENVPRASPSSEHGTAFAESDRLSSVGWSDSSAR